MGKRVLCLLILCVLGAAVFVQSALGAESAENTEGAVEAASGSNTAIWRYFAAALAVGISCIAGGIAVGQIGSAAMGAMSENADLSGKALPYAGLAEGICLWGFLVALLILIL
jgi:V/A-type H+-transporting ATPase subunit K